MKRVIARDVMAGVLGGLLKCIDVYGNSVLPLFKTHATRQLYSMCYLKASPGENLRSGHTRRALTRVNRPNSS